MVFRAGPRREDTKSDDLRRRPSGAPTVPSLLLVAFAASMAACMAPDRSEGAGGAPPEEVIGAHADALISDWDIQPAVQLNNSIDDSYAVGQSGYQAGNPGFSVFWQAASAPSMPATLKIDTVGGRTSNQVFTCPASNKYCKITVLGNSITAGLHLGDAVHYTVTAGAVSSSDQFQYFKAAAAPFKFVFLSDPQGRTTMENSVFGGDDGYAGGDDYIDFVIKKVKAEHPDFVVTGGDHGVTRGNAPHWLAQMTGVEKNDNAYNVLGSSPGFFAMGNHDWWTMGMVRDNANWPSLLTYLDGDPDNNLDSQNALSAKNSHRYNSFDYGNSHFVILDTGFHDVGDLTVHTQQFGYGHSVFDQAQLDWLTSDLQAVKTRPWIVHKFAVMHISPYNTNADSEVEKSSLVPILTKNGVQIVLAGHRHNYQHLFNNGIHYYLAGTAGGPLAPNGNYGTDTACMNDSANSHNECFGFGQPFNTYCFHEGTCCVEATNRSSLTGSAVVDQPFVPFWGYLVVNVNGNDVTVLAKDVLDVNEDPNSNSHVDRNEDFSDHHTPPPSNLTAWTLTNTSASHYARVSWENTAPNATNYLVSWSADNVNWSVESSTGTQTYYDYPMAVGSTDYFRVRTQTSDGWTSDYNTQPYTYTFPWCKVEQLYTAYALGWAALSWSPFSCNSPSLVKYEVQRAIVGGANGWVNAFETTSSGPVYDKTVSCNSYVYRVRAVLTGNRHSDWSDISSTVDAHTATCAPDNLVAQFDSYYGAQLNWSDSGANCYAVERSPAMADTWTTLKTGSTLDPDAGRYAAQGMTCNTSYDFRVRYYSCATSATISSSNLASGVTMACMPTPMVTATGKVKSIQLTISYAAPTSLPQRHEIWVRRHGTTNTYLLTTLPSWNGTSATAIDDDTGCLTQWDYAVKGFILTTLDDGTVVPSNSDFSPWVTAAGLCSSGCANDAVPDQIFSPGMEGCGGTKTWDLRNDLCAPGYSACTASQWNLYRGSTAPTNDYWTNDNLGYGGTQLSCQANTSGTTSCGTNRPMRVCTPGGTDSYGNTCTWTGCGLNTVTPQYFGGCVSNPTAGTLCCKSPAYTACATGAGAQNFAAGVSGCPGHVYWEDRDSLCAAGCTACTASEYKQYHSSIAPTHNYWTADDLNYTGTGPDACGATMSGGSSCGSVSHTVAGVTITNQTPMRVCKAGGGTDTESNACNWGDCGLNGNTPGTTDDYFGGCSGNATAGAMCCCDR